MADYEVVIIGAGAVGCAAAYVLSGHELNIAVMEKEADAAFGISGRNSGVVHAGFNNVPGSLKAKLCVEGSRRFEDLAMHLGVKYIKTGKYVTGFSDADRTELERLLKQGKDNGVEGLEIVKGDRIREKYPEVKGNFALWSPQTGIFDPFEYTVKLAEKAHEMGAVFLFDSKLVKIEKEETGGFRLSYEKTVSGNPSKETGSITAKTVISCAGLYSAEICRMAGIDRFDIKPCRGEYHILDKKYSKMVNVPVYPVPDKEKGVLGVHLTPTVSGNMMIGPSAEFLDEKDDYSNDEGIMQLLKDGAEMLMPELKDAAVIRSFSGIRPKLIDKEGKINADFVIESSEECPGFIYLVGIESPGITASMPIAEMAADLAVRTLGVKPVKNTWMNSAQKEVSDEPSYSPMVCRCEKVTERDILKAYDDIVKIGAVPTLKGIKNRTRAGMGSCQGSFCTVDIAEILRRYRNVDISEITYDGAGSELFLGQLK
ncbi:MAG: NAD(P)/FAD-dependent oxidoreductase [Clostridiales bacterium]|nr:NAD(P)/FAD-dependent oxidoreductase [Clostridiales bacterium]